MRPSDLFGGGTFGRQVRRPGAGRIPVTVLTGFLGAGKTSLIRATLAHPGAARTAVIVNEFAEVGVDDVLLRTGVGDIRLIGNGCMCCAARSDLQRVLRTLFAERETGAVPPFDRVVVETSGLSDPAPVLQALAGDRTLSRHYATSALVCAVDGVLGRDADEDLWTAQVALADRIVLTKTDLVSETHQALVRARIADLNPGAEILEAGDLRADPAAWLAPLEAGPASAFRAAAASGAAPDKPAFQSFVLTFDTPFRWPHFLQAMETLLALRGDDVLRVKGLVNVAGCAGPVVAHFVRHLAAQPEELTAWPDDDRRTHLVFITRGLDRARVAALFEAVLALVAAPAEA